MGMAWGAFPVLLPFGLFFIGLSAYLVYTTARTYVEITDRDITYFNGRHTHTERLSKINSARIAHICLELRTSHGEAKPIMQIPMIIQKPGVLLKVIEARISH